MVNPDELLEETSEEDFDEQVEPTKEELKVITQAYDLSLQTLHEQWTAGILFLPEIQREYIWDNGKASRLIESLILNIPIPAVYFAETDDSKFEVIDGHQRVRSVSRFLSNQFNLAGISVLTHLRGLRFHQLDDQIQRRLKSRILRAIIIQPESHPVARFEVFERLNSGAVSLTAQELRNSIFRGPYNDLLRELAKLPAFRAMIGAEKPRKRMVDEELVLRFFALKEKLNTYRPSLKRFLNNHMKTHEADLPEQLAASRQVFESTIAKLAAIFPNRAFRIHNAQGEPTERSVNRALYDAYMLAFAWLPETPTATQVPVVRQRLADLQNSKDFVDAIQRATGDRSRTILRVQLTIEALASAGVHSVPPYRIDPDSVV